MVLAKGKVASYRPESDEQAKVQYSVNMNDGEMRHAMELLQEFRGEHGRKGWALGGRG